MKTIRMMIGRRQFGIILAAALALAGCKSGESPSYRYKLSVTVETPEGTRTAYSVIGVQFYGAMKGFEALSGGTIKARGEAVALDLPDGKALFVLLRSETSQDWASQAHWRLYPKQPSEFETTAKFYEAMINDKTLYSVPREIEGIGGEMVDSYPLLVTFKDINNPTSVERVDPDNLAVSFGAGYKFKSLTVQVTDEPVSTGIGKRLGWLGEYPEPRLDPKYKGSISPDISQKLSHGDFVRNTSK